MRDSEERDRREKKGGRRIEKGIEEREWKEYFMGLLRGVEGRVVEGGRREKGSKNGIER